MPKNFADGKPHNGSLIRGLTVGLLSGLLYVTRDCEKIASGWRMDRSGTETACKSVGYAQPLYSLDLNGSLVGFNQSVC
jgi:hypothetical protein